METPTTIQPDVTPSTEPTHGSPPSVEVIRNMNFLSLQGFFGIQNPDIELESDLNYIYDFYEKRGVRTMAEMLLNIRDAEHRLGAVPINISRANYLKMYLKTQSSIDTMLTEQRAMER